MTTRSSRTVRSPSFPSFDRNNLWVERTRDLASNDIERSVIEGAINAMSDGEVTAALASLRIGMDEEEVEDPLVTGTPAATAPVAKPPPVTVEDGSSNNGHTGENSDSDDDPTNRYSLPDIRAPPLPHPTPRPDGTVPSSRGPDIPDIPVQPYVSQRHVRYEEPRRVDLPREFARESTTDSMRARRAPIPTIESQSKPPTKFKGEDSTFIKVDVFLKKMERYLRNGHGLDLATEDIADYMFDSLNDYAHRWFETVRRPYPYLFSHFNRDLRARYVPANYKDQLSDEYESVQQGDERLFTDYLTKLRDYEAMLEDTSV
jgi:hypothetical protein